MISRRFFADAVAEEGIVGAGMYLVGPNGVVDSAFAGFADRESGRKANGATIWHWASITKTFTAIAIMQLRDRGRLAIDDPIIKYVPELSEVHNPFGPIVAGDDSPAAVALGRVSDPGPGRGAGTSPGTPSSRPGGASWWRCCPTPRSNSRRASKYQYSNPGYVFLGQTIERLAGEDFEVYMQKNVLSPLGMTHSYYDLTPYHLIADRSNNYYVKDGQAGRQRPRLRHRHHHVKWRAQRAAVRHGSIHRVSCSADRRIGRIGGDYPISRGLAGRDVEAGGARRWERYQKGIGRARLSS